MIEEIKRILHENQDKRVCVLGTTCTGKTTILKGILEGADMDELIFPLLTPEEDAYVNQDPWTPEIGEFMNYLVKTKIKVEKSRPVFGTVLIDCDLVIYLDIDDELLQERTEKRGVKFENAVNMREAILHDIEKSNIPCIKAKVINETMNKIR